MVIFFYQSSKERTIATAFFSHIGRKTARISGGIIYFFQYIGFLNLKLLFTWRAIQGRATMLKSLKTGSKLAIPLILVSILLGFSLTVSINYLLAPYNLQNKVILIAQNTLIRDIAPLMISLVLCISAGLDLIDVNHPSLHKSPEVVMLQTIIPLIIATNITAILLYIYIAAAFHLTISFTVYYYLEGNITGYLLNLGSLINKTSLIISFINTIVYASIASIIVGFYYFEVSIRGLSSQRAVSKIITRGLFWLVGISGFIKYFFPYS